MADPPEIWELHHEGRLVGWLLRYDLHGMPRILAASSYDIVMNFLAMGRLTGARLAGRIHDESEGQ